MTCFCEISKSELTLTVNFAQKMALYDSSIFPLSHRSECLYKGNINEPSLQWASKKLWQKSSSSPIPTFH